MHLGTKPGRVSLGVGLLALAVRLALLPIRPIPQPAVHDEFAYLLGAETFCLGRVTNPPHPMWVHLETFHELFQPTYASKYPPAQSLFLALGWKLFGHPWYGVWLSCGLMCTALCWMLQGWLPPRYALLGGLMAVAQWGVAGYWVNSYMGGAVAAAAGALVVGAVPRLARRPTAGVAALAALGAVALANSRPFEGAVATVGAAVVLLIWRRKRGRSPLRQLLAWRTAAPAGAILGCGLAAMLYYNYRVTGHALLMPYALYQSQYAASPLFWMLPLGPPPAYRHEVMRQLWLTWDMPHYRLARSFPPRIVIPLMFALRYFLNPVSAMAFFAGVFLRRTFKVCMVLALSAFSIAGLLLERFTLPHYLAPVTGSVLIAVLLGAQFLRVKFGARSFAAFVALFFATAVFQICRLTEDEYPHKLFTAHRQDVIRQLEAAGGRNLVVVRYAPRHDPHEDWVYNRADIDAAPIVWARDMGEARNRELLEYYQDRKVWLLEADAPDPKPVPYPPLPRRSPPVGSGAPTGNAAGPLAARPPVACPYPG
jgi:hypothetical protein